MNTMREKLWFLYLAALAALYLPPRGCGIRPGQWPKREIFSWRKWFMGSRRSNSWVNNVPRESSEVCWAALTSTGNKSPNVPRMKEASQVSQSKHGDSAACRSDWNMTRFLLVQAAEEKKEMHTMIWKASPVDDASAGLSSRYKQRPWTSRRKFLKLSQLLQI